MKKTIMILAMAVFSLQTVNAAKEEKLSAVIVKNFSVYFGAAIDAKWTSLNGYQIAHFVQNGKQTEAFFDEEGVLLGYGRYIQSEDLPASVIERLNKKFGNYELIKVMEFVRTYAPLEYVIEVRASNKSYGLRVTLTGDVQICKVVK